MAFDTETFARLSAKDVKQQWGERSLIRYTRAHANEIACRLRAADALESAARRAEDRLCDLDITEGAWDILHDALSAYDAARKEPDR